MTFWVILTAPLIGLLLAMFGAGGGMVTVPLLIYGLGMPLKSAVLASLLVVACVSLITLLRQRGWGKLHTGLLAFIAAGGMLGSWLGAHIGLALSDKVQGSIFAALIWLVAWWMHRPRSYPKAAVPGHGRYALALLTGVMLGMTTGVLGVGSGFLMVPALMWLGINDFRVAANHSLVLITLNAVIAGATYLGRVDMAWQPVFLVLGLACAGCLVGCRLTAYFSAERLQTMFSVVLALVGSAMMFEVITR